MILAMIRHLTTVLATTALLVCAAAPTTQPGTLVAAKTEVTVSPAGCHVLYVTDPHFSSSVPGAVKVNVKSECNSTVPELDLSVTLLVDGRPAAKTIAKAVNKSYILNQGTFVMCKNRIDSHTFAGAALGTSFEGNRPYVEIKAGRDVVLPCGV